MTTYHDPFWYGITVMVTGVKGLIGRPLTKMLLDLGCNVHGFDLLMGAPEGFKSYEGYSHHRGNIQSKQRLYDAMEGCDLVIHLAANSGVEASASEGVTAWTANFMGTLTVMESARRRGNIPVVFASTNHVYGEQGGVPTDENAPMLRLDTYSASKIAADYCVRSYAFQYGVPAVVLRNTNCFGADDPHVDHIIPGTVRAFVSGKVPVIKSNGLTKKSYLYVDDVARAYIAAAKYAIEERPRGEIFNITGEPPISTRDLVYLIREVMGSDTRPEVLGRHREDDVSENLDDSKAREVLGWAPEVSLREGIVRVVESFQVRYGNGVLA